MPISVFIIKIFQCCNYALQYGIDLASAVFRMSLIEVSSSLNLVLPSHLGTNHSSKCTTSGLKKGGTALSLVWAEMRTFAVSVAIMPQRKLWYVTSHVVKFFSDRFWKWNSITEFEAYFPVRKVMLTVSVPSNVHIPFLLAFIYFCILELDL